MDYIIVSNNKKILDEFENAIGVQGQFIEVLYRVRDMVHSGYRLVSHPLGASIRIMYSPVRSILIEKISGEVDESSLDIIETSIEKYKTTMGKRNPDTKNLDDYILIDYDLCLSAIKENEFIGQVMTNIRGE